MDKKIKLYPRDLSVVIASIGISKNLIKTINSIQQSSTKPKETILVMPDCQSNRVNLRYVKTYLVKKKNQIYQRNFGMSKISKKSKLLLQLDDSAMLDKNCIKNLIKSWNEAEPSIKGIGLNPKGQIKPLSSIFQKITLTNSNDEGIILRSGFAMGWNSHNKDFYSEWLNGGWVSWNLDKIKFLKKRKFPEISWCVAEDVIMSLLNYKPKCYLISHKSKVNVLKKEKKITLYKKFMEGYLHSKIIHSYVRMFKKFSINAYYYSIFSSSILGIVNCVLTLNFKDIMRFCGRFLGMFSYYEIKNFK